MMKKAGLEMESVPVVALYLNGCAGRRAKKMKDKFPCQSSVTILAHKIGGVFVCNGGGTRSCEAPSRASRSNAVQPPRTSALDQIGAIVSNNFPSKGTFLADGVIEVLVRR